MKSVPISPAVFQVYRTAATLLARIMGADAPDAMLLIQHELTARKAQLIADDYLDQIRWRKIRRVRKPTAHSRADQNLSLHLLRRIKSCRGRPTFAEPGHN